MKSVSADEVFRLRIDTGASAQSVQEMTSSLEDCQAAADRTGVKLGQFRNMLYALIRADGDATAALRDMRVSLADLESSLASAFLPIISTAAPLLGQLCDMLATAASYVSMFFAILGGRKTYKRAVAGQDAYTKSVKGSSAAAKKLVQNLSGLDELHLWDSGSGGRGRGSGSGGSGNGIEFEDVEIPGPVLDLAQRIREAIAAGDWYAVGATLAEKLNGVIAGWDADGWGRKLGRTVQRALRVFLGFVDTLDIEGLGEKVAGLIGNALREIDPRDLGGVLASGIKAIFRFAHGFLQGYTGPEIGAYIAGIVNGWFAKIRENDGWKKAGEDLNRAILGIINGVINFLETLDTGAIVRDLKDFFGGIDWAEIWGGLQRAARTAGEVIPWREILSGITDVLSDVLPELRDALQENDFTKLGEEMKDTLARALGSEDWDSLTEALRDRMFSAVSSAWDRVMDTLYRVIKGKNPKLAAVLFPDRAAVDRYGDQFQRLAENKGREAAEGWVEKLQAHGALSESAAKMLIDSAADGLEQGMEERGPAIREAADSYGQSVAEGIAGSAETAADAADAFVQGIDGKLQPLFLPLKKSTFLDELSGNVQRACKKIDSSKVVIAATAELSAVRDGLTVPEKTIGITARYAQADDQLPRAQKIIGTTARFTGTDKGRLADADTRIDATAVYKASDSSGLTAGQRTIGTTALYSSVNAGKLTDSMRTINVCARYNSVKSELSASEKTILTTAKYTSAVSGLASKPIISSVAKLTSYTNSLPYKPTISATARIDSYVRNGNNSVRLATGGIFAGGAWRDIAGYAAGGVPKRSRLFYANENGMPELIGSIGGHTAVMNNRQIVASVAAGVYKAVAAAFVQMRGYFGSISREMGDIPRALAAIPVGIPTPVMAEGTVLPPRAVYAEDRSDGLVRAVRELRDMITGTGKDAETPINVNVKVDAQVDRKNLFSAVVTESRIQRRATGRDPFAG